MNPNRIPSYFQFVFTYMKNRHALFIHTLSGTIIIVLIAIAIIVLFYYNDISMHLQVESENCSCFIL